MSDLDKSADVRGSIATPDKNIARAARSGECWPTRTAHCEAGNDEALRQQEEPAGEVKEA